LTLLGIVIVDDSESKGRNGPMSSTVWAVPATRVRDTYILRFLKDAPCFVRVVEVRLFKTGRLFDRAPVDRRRWEPCDDLPETAREISDFIADSGSAEATIVASDEL
jgi:hypothetical protein